MPFNFTLIIFFLKTEIFKRQGSEDIDKEARCSQMMFKQRILSHWW